MKRGPLKDAALAAVYNVRLMRRSHLNWPDLDVDLEIASLEHPERYPLSGGEGIRGTADHEQSS